MAGSWLMLSSVADGHAIFLGWGKPVYPLPAIYRSLVELQPRALPRMILHRWALQLQLQQWIRARGVLQLSGLRLRVSTRSNFQRRGLPGAETAARMAMELLTERILSPPWLQTKAQSREIGQRRIHFAKRSRTQVFIRR